MAAAVMRARSAFISLFVNAQQASPVKTLREGPFSEFSTGWYQAVGVVRRRVAFLMRWRAASLICLHACMQALLLTMFINIAVPHIAPIIALISTKLARLWDRSCTRSHSRTKKMTQDELVELYTGPSFMLAERYAQLWNSMCVIVYHDERIAQRKR